MTPEPKDVPMEQISYEGGTGPRFMLLVFTQDTHQLLRKYGGDPVEPLYGPQARRLRREQRKAGFLTQLIRLRPDGGWMIDSDFPVQIEASPLARPTRHPASAGDLGLSKIALAPDLGTDMGVTRWSRS